MRRPLALLAAVVCAALLAACSSSPTTSAATTTTTATTPPAQPTTSAQPAAAVVGQIVTNKGVTLTVTKVSSPATIDMNESGSIQGSGYEKYTKKSPQAGGKFVQVDTHIVNDAQVSMDLTCSLPVLTKLVDSRQRNFDPIDDLYKLRGNPECNKQLQPGFESDMTWVYEIPTSAVVAGFAFKDLTDMSNAASSTWGTVAFTV